MLGLGLAGRAGVAAVPSDLGTPSAVEWLADPAGSCDRGPELRTLVARLAGPDLALRAEVEVSIRESVFHAVVRVHSGGQTQERSLSSPHCASLVRGAAIILAVSADPVQTASALRVREPTLEEPDPPVIVPRPPDTAGPTGMVNPNPARARESSPVPSEGSHRTHARPNLHALGEAIGTVDLRGHFGAGVVPGFSGGVGGGLTLGREHLAGRLGGTTWAPRRASLDGATDVGVEVSGWSLDPQLCSGFGSQRWSLQGCLGGELGQLSGRGEGRSLSASRTQTRLWAAVAASLAGRFAVHPRLLLGVWGAMNVPVMRAKFVLRDGRELFATTALGWRAGFELVARFW
ncbi:MAG: hypothetical protein ACRBN8_11410 [Nannocystales bacterium]